MPDLNPYAKDGNVGVIQWQPVRTGEDAKPGRYRFEVYGTGGQPDALLELIDPFGRHVKVRHDGELQAVRFHNGRPLFTERNTHLTLTADPGYQITTDVVHGDEWYVDYNPGNAAGWLKKGILPARFDWVPKAVKNLILESDRPAYLPDRRVYTEQERPETMPGDPVPPWARIIVLLNRASHMTGPAMPISPTGQRTVDVCVYIEVASDPEKSKGWDYMTACDDISEIVHNAIAGETKTADGEDLDPRHKIVFPLYRVKEKSPPIRDDRANTWITEVDYRMVIQRRA